MDRNELQAKLDELGVTDIDQAIDRTKGGLEKNAMLKDWLATEVLPTYLQAIVVQGRRNEILDVMHKGAAVLGALDLIDGIINASIEGMSELRDRED